MPTSRRPRARVALALALLLSGCSGGRRYEATEEAFWTGTIIMGAPFVVALLPFTVWFGWGALYPAILGAPLGAVFAGPTFLVEAASQAGSRAAPVAPEPEPDRPRERPTRPRAGRPVRPREPDRARGSPPRADRPRPRWPAPRARSRERLE